MSDKKIITSFLKSIGKTELSELTASEFLVLGLTVSELFEVARENKNA